MADVSGYPVVRGTARPVIAVATSLALLLALMSVVPASAAPGPIANTFASISQHNVADEATASCDGSTIEYDVSGGFFDPSVGWIGTYEEVGTATLSGSADPMDLWYKFNTSASNIVALTATWTAEVGDTTYSGTRTLGSPLVGSVFGGSAANVGSCAPLSTTDLLDGYCTHGGCDFNGAQRQIRAWSDWEATVTGPGGSHHEFGSSIVTLNYVTGTYTLFHPDCPECSGVGIPVPASYRNFNTNFITATIGNTPEAGFEIFTGAAALGNVELGQVVETNVQAYNWGTAPATISAINVSGDDAGQLSLSFDSCLDGPVNPANYCAHYWTFTAIDQGPIDITIEILSDDPDSPHIVAISGTVIQPRALEVTPSGYDFGEVGLGYQASQEFVIRNTGGGPVDIWSVGLNGGWGEFDAVPISEDCTVNRPLPVGDSCTATVTFTPSSVGAKTGRLYLSTDLISTVVYVDLQGVGAVQAPVVTIDPPSYDWGIVHDTAGHTFTVTNSGTGTLLISSIEIVGGPTPFGLTPSDCFDVAIPGGASCYVLIIIDGAGPDDEDVLRQGNLVVSSNATNSPTLASLSVIADFEPDSPDQVSEDPGPGGTVETGSGEATPDDPTTTAVTTPVGGQVTINESAGTPPASGYGFAGQSVEISAPNGTITNPLRLTFRLDASAIPAGHDETTIEVFRNGVLVSECTNPGSGDAVPNPCVDERTVLGDGDISITALTSQASVWQLGVVNPYPFAGFFAPVDNLPTVNKANSGQAIPVKFSLGGNRGMDIFAGDGPYSQRTTCDSGAPVDAIETVVTSGQSTLTYDAGSNRYQFVWKTQKAWAGTCRTLTLHFADGTMRTAVFNFKK